MLIPQDVVRREILKTSDEPGNDAIELIYDMAMYGYRKGYDVIVEGILSKDKYGDMLAKMMNNFEGRVSVYYLDIPFEETVRRHVMKDSANEFGEKEMKEWWKDNDHLGVNNEVILSSDLSEDALVKTLMLAVKPQ